MTRQQHIQRAYARIAKNYDRVATLQQAVGDRLLQRLSYLKLIPRTILELGCGTGNFLTQLKHKYPQALIIGLDLSSAMLKCYKAPLLMRQKPRLLVGDMEHLPIDANTIDLIFANQSIYWADDSVSLWRELNRVLATDGVIMFSTLGPDTCSELRQAWAQVDSYPHLNQFKDMHDLGDELLASSFAEPVVDMEYFKVRYAKPQQLLHDLKQQGDKNLHQQRLKGLMGKQTFQQLLATLNTSKVQPQGLQLTYEIIYGQAWKAKPKNNKVGNEIRIPVDQIGKRSG